MGSEDGGVAVGFGERNGSGTMVAVGFGLAVAVGLGAGVLVAPGPGVLVGPGSGVFVAPGLGVDVALRGEKVTVGITPVAVGSGTAFIGDGSTAGCLNLKPT